MLGLWKMARKLTLTTNKMNKRELIKLSAQGFIDDIYDQIRKEDYSEDYQIEVISEIQKILINELKILK